MSVLGELEAHIAIDFVDKLKKLVAIFGARLSADGQRKQMLLEAAEDTLAVEIFQKTRALIWQYRDSIRQRNVEALTARARAEAQATGGEGVLTEALQLWNTSANRDKRKAFQLADDLVNDVQEWESLGGEI
jgi:hypothetical protein